LEFNYGAVILYNVVIDIGQFFTSFFYFISSAETTN